MMEKCGVAKPITEKPVAEIPLALRDDLLTYLFCTSPARARIIAELLVRHPGMGRATGRP